MTPDQETKMAVTIIIILAILSIISVVVEHILR